MRDRTQGHRPLLRAIEQAVDPLWQALYGLIEWTSITQMSAPAGQAPSASTDDDDDVQVLESYGFASRPPGAATAIVIAPGTETQDRVAIGVSSLGGRPATEAGDVAVWTAGGHQVALDDDDALTVTGKDGQSMVMQASGDMTITLAAGKSLTINVSGGGDVKIGGAGAVELLKALATENYIVAAANGVTGSPDVEAGFTAFASALAGLADAAKTQKAKGE